MAKQIDTVTVEVVRNLLMSIAEETYGIIVRSAYSTNMKERDVYKRQGLLCLFKFHRFVFNRAGL